MKTIWSPVLKVPLTVMGVAVLNGADVGVTEVTMGTAAPIAKVEGADVAPAKESVTGTLPAVCTRVAGMVTVTCVALLGLAVKLVPLKLIVAVPEVNPPVTVTVRGKAADPAGTVFGLKDEITGITFSVAEVVDCVPAEFAARTVLGPRVVRRFAGTVVWS